MKEKQCACARCGIEISDSTFGAIGYECDCVEEIYRENDESNKKIEISRVVKWNFYTALCHLRVKYTVVVELPNVLTRKYDSIPPRAVSVYLDSSEGKIKLNDFNLAWHADDLLERWN